jgi:two-component system OmpR family sensor kinase
MFPPAGSERKLKPSGLLIAVIGFVVTRTTVLEALVLGGLSSAAAVVRLLPLVVGFGVIALGVSLAVSTFDREYVDTVARWTVLGTVGMLVVVFVSLFDPATGVDTFLSRLATDVVVANALLGGAAAGTVIGLRSASNHRQRRLLSRQADRGVLLTRLLRHEVLNAVTAIDGHAALLYEKPDERSRRAIRDGVDRIERTVDDVGTLLRPEDGREQWLTSVGLAAALRQAADAVDDENSQHVVEVETPDDSVTVRADEHLETVLADLFEHAADGAETAVTVETALRDTEVDVWIRMGEPWLDDLQRTALTESLPKFDTPSVGYELPVARLLVEQYGGRIRTEDGGRTVVVTLPLTTPERTDTSDRPGVTPRDIRRVSVAALVAGVAMGIVSSQFGTGLPIIGALYGVDSAAVGWITHLFHSVIFGVVFAAVLDQYDVRQRVEAAGTVAVLGAGYGVFLWLVAAGVVMSLWLNAVGIATPLPNLTVTGLFGHALWGTLLGGGYALLPERFA